MECDKKKMVGLVRRMAKTRSVANHANGGLFAGKLPIALSIVPARRGIFQCS